MKAVISQLLGAPARAVPTPKVYTYDEVKSHGKLNLQLYSIPWGNEAEILIIAILVKNKFFDILGGKKFLGHFRGRNLSERLGDVCRGEILIFLVYERLSDVFRGKCKNLS